VNSLRYYNIELGVIEFAQYIIRDVLPLKQLKKTCTALGIICSVFYVNETGKLYNPKQYEN
jgi:hypothetical protein